MSATALREKRQTTIPQEVAEAADVHPGDIIDWRFEEGEIRGRKMQTAETCVIGLNDVDPKTFLPKDGAKPMIESIRPAVKAGRER
jgi:bifunctional DNA-binding transcriptional regulator/antitoxin component of YhaV-PrlF toxin-antitoxin module